MTTNVRPTAGTGAVLDPLPDPQPEPPPEPIPDPLPDPERPTPQPESPGPMHRGSSEESLSCLDGIGGRGLPTRGSHDTPDAASAAKLVSEAVRRLQAQLVEDKDQWMVSPAPVSAKTRARQTMAKEGGKVVAKTVRDVMTSNVRAAASTDSLADAAQMMKEEDVGSLPVVEDDRLIGILTDRDIIVRAVAERVDPQSISVGDVASRELVTVDPDQDLDEALSLMARHRVRRLPVVADGRLVGILAQADVAIEAKEKNAGEMLEEISQPTSTPRE